MMRLIESTAHPHVRPGWTLGSAFVHGSLIGMTIVMTMRAPARTAAVPDPVRLVYTEGPAQRAPDAGPTTIRVPMPPGITVPSITLPNVARIEMDLPARISVGGTPSGRVIDGEGVPSAGSGWGRGSGSTLDPGAVHASSEVDRAVLPLATNPRPDYPASLRAAGAEGEVVVRFVVDTGGAVEPGSIAVLSATHPLFGDAVRRWLPRTRYAAAEAAGRRVRQLVQQRVAFDLVR